MALPQDIRDLDVQGVFTDFSDAQLQTYLDLAECFISQSYFAECYDQAHAMYAMHTAFATQSTPGGQVTSASAGGLSTSFATAVSDEDLQSTAYGRMYSMLRRSRLARLC